MEEEYILAWYSNNKRWLYGVVEGEQLRWTPRETEATRLRGVTAVRWQERLIGGDVHLRPIRPVAYEELQ